jgi:hypothetical protein
VPWNDATNATMPSIGRPTQMLNPYFYARYTATSATTNIVNVWYSTTSTPVYHDIAELQARAIRSHPKEAQDRARDLLLAHLTPKQRRTFEENGWFVVEGGKTGRPYRIRAKEDLVANIDVVEDDRTLYRLCGHCGLKEVPLGDHLLAQKLMLEGAEEEFLRLANRHAA